ncbi:NAD(P)/FAD-dependent oxidoreductase [Sinorhizobium meliloti]|uniref:NAD(P)/FAD-dependent oxidoreductase n=2 Tax=Rhizobium meliloti TaxID=382 RepID=UPI002D21A7BB|nr:NAD(P)/FAD-dependent oxidoreductase [Sinorhizobium meliloti]
MLQMALHALYSRPERNSERDSGMELVVDAAIVGAGVAGLSTALFLGRADRSAIVFDGGTTRIESVEEVREYLGFDGLPPQELLSRARAEVHRYGVEIKRQRVTSVTPRADGLFEVHHGHSVTMARTVVLATGLIDKLPPLSGVSKAWGRDLRVCPCFDGYEVRGKRFVVFGVPKRLVHMASWVWMWSRDVTVVSEHAFTDAELDRLRLLDIDVIADEVTGLVHSGERLEALSTRGGKSIACGAAWIPADMVAASDLAASLCDVDDMGLARIDSGGRTSRAGVFAVGNAADPAAHLAHASAAGTNVGPHVVMYLLEREIERRTTNQ